MDYDLNSLKENAHASLKDMASEEKLKTLPRLPEGKIRGVFSPIADILPKKPTFIQCIKELLFSAYLRKQTQKQYVLVAPASSGKTTELKKLALALLDGIDKNEKGTGRSIVHFCSMQNFSQSNMSINSDEDLWEMISDCHQSPDWAKKSISMNDFSKMHQDMGWRPILLVDTLDLLTYGMTKSEIDKIGTYWETLLKRMDKSGFTVLWTTRPEEFQMLRGPSTGLKKLELPRIDYTETLGLIKTSYFDESKEDFLRFMALVVQTFPILSRFASHDDRLQHQFLKTLEDKFNDMKVSEGAGGNASPIVWVQKVIGAELPVDHFYDSVKNRVFEYVSNTLQNDQDLGQDDLNKIWNENIEAVILQKSLNKNILHGARLKIPRNFSHSSHKDLVEYMVQIASREGLMKINPADIEFTHQLYAEYCIYNRAREYNRIKKVQLFPSVKLRSLHIDAGEIEGGFTGEYIQWYLPYFIFNESLLRRELNKTLASGDWEWVYDKLDRYLTLTNNSMDFLNPQKRKLANKIKDGGALANSPVFINGPPGTGKSLFANEWFQLKGERYSKRIDEKPNGTFISLSKQLSKQHIVEFNKYFKNMVKPVSLNSLSIDDLLRELTGIMTGEQVSEKEFDQMIISETDFINKVRRKTKHSGSPFALLVQNKSVYSLWNEFVYHLHKEEDGTRIISFNKYLKGVKSSQKSLFSPTINTNTSKSQKEAKCFFETMRELFPSGDDDPKTRGEHAGTLADYLVEEFYNPNIDLVELGEKILPFRSNILVIDEVQDLDTHLIKLCFLLHRGERHEILVLGDDEQTLDLIPFDWPLRFKEVATSLHNRSERVDLDIGVADKLNIGRWRNFSLQDIAEKREQFTEVERNTPAIVRFIKYCFANSVLSNTIGEQYSRGVMGSGAAIIEPGPFSKDKLEKIKKLEKQGELVYHGVHYNRTPLNMDDFLSLAKAVYDSGVVVSIIAPNEKIQQQLAERLGEKKIKIPLWHPNSIKGLEYKKVIAISPWAVDKKRFEEFIVRKDVETWDDAMKLFQKGSDNDDEWKKKFKLLANQRKRHANVMVSRPKELLVALELADESLLPTANFSIEDWLEKDENKEEFGEIPWKFTGTQSLIKMIEKSQEHGGIGNILGYVLVLSEIIASDKADEHIILQAEHILNLIERQKEKVESHMHPFRLISKLKDNQEHIDPWIGLELVLFNQSFRTKEKHDEITKIQNKFFELSTFVKYDPIEDKVRIPVSVYDNFSSFYRELIDTVTIMPKVWSDSDMFEKEDLEAKLNSITDYLRGEFFSTIFDDNEVDKWIKVAKLLDINTDTLVAEEGDEAFIFALYDPRYYDDKSDENLGHLQKDRGLGNEDIPDSWKKAQRTDFIKKNLIGYDKDHPHYKDLNANNRWIHQATEVIFKQAKEAGWLSSNRSTREDAIEFLERKSREALEQENLGSEWWSNGVEHVRNNEISEEDLEDILSHYIATMKAVKSKSSNSNLIKSAEQLECLYEMTIFIGSRTGRIEKLMEQLELLARDSLEIKCNINLMLSSLGEPHRDIFANRLIQSSDSFPNLIKRNMFNTFGLLNHYLSSAKTSKSHWQLNHATNFTQLLNHAKHSLSEARYQKLLNHVGPKIEDALEHSLGQGQTNSTHEKAVNDFFRDYSDDEIQKGIVIKDVIYNEAIGILPGQFGKSKIHDLLEKYKSDLKLKEEGDYDPELMSSENPIDQSEYLFLSHSLAHSLIRTFYVHKFGTSRNYKHDSKFFTELRNCIYDFSRQIPRFPGVVIDLVKDHGAAQGYNKNLAHPILDMAPDSDDFNVEASKDTYHQWRGIVSQFLTGLEPHKAAISLLDEAWNEWKFHKKNADGQKYFEDANAPVVRPPQNQLAKNGLEWMLSASRKVDRNKNALCDYYVREYLNGDDRSWVDQAINDMKYGRYDSTNHLLNNYHYRFGNKRTTVRISLPIYFWIEILSRETLEHPSALEIINACVLEYEQSTSGRFMASTLLSNAMKKLSPGTKLFEGDDKMNHKKASIAIGKILMSISGQVSTNHEDDNTDQKQINAFNHDSGEQIVRLKSLKDYLLEELVKEKINTEAETKASDDWLNKYNF